MRGGHSRGRTTLGGIIDSGGEGCNPSDFSVVSSESPTGESDAESGVSSVRVGASEPFVLSVLAAFEFKPPFAFL